MKYIAILRTSRNTGGWVSGPSTSVRKSFFMMTRMLQKNGLKKR